MSLVLTRIVLVILFLCSTSAANAQAPPNRDQVPEAQFAWEELTALPDEQGFAGGFSGVSHGVLLFAGGTNRADAVSSESGAAIWHDSIFALEEPHGRWKKLTQRLPHRLAYGASVTHDEKVICIGGDDGSEVFAEVFSLQWDDGAVVIKQLPPLPHACTWCCSGVVGAKLYVAGGLSRLPPDENPSFKPFWVLDLNDIEAGWKELPPWPGPARAGAVSAVVDKKFFIVGGMLSDTAAASEQKQPAPALTDGYRYTPGRSARPSRWDRIADLPRGAIGAAQPAPALGQQHFLFVGGMDAHTRDWAGATEQKYAASHAAPTQCLAYHAITDTWTAMGAFPDVGTTRAYMPTVRWNDAWVLVGGAAVSGERTPRVVSLNVVQKRRELGFLNLSVLVIYLAILVGMGFYFSKREKSTDDFFLGGRRIPWWAAGISILGTTLSSISFMAVPAKVYATNWLYFAFVIGDVLVPLVVVFFYVPFFRRLNITSAYEYLEKRFNLLARLLGSAAFIFFQTGRMTIVLFLPALALSAVSGINVYICILAIGLLATLYTVMGGIEAVIWTDFLQVIVLIGGALLSLIIISLKVDGGVWGIVEIARTDGKLQWLDLRLDYAAPVLGVVVFGSIFQNLVTFSADQAVIQRYLTTKDEKATARALYLNAALAVPLALIFFALGTALYAFYKTHPESLNPALSTDQTFPLFIAQQLPPGILGLVVAGLFAASMSTVDSSLNSISTAITTDFYRRFKPNAEDRTCLNLARWLTLLFGALATGIALFLAANQEQIRSLWDMYIQTLGLLMGSVAGLFALGIFTRRAGSTGGLIGAAAGAAILFCVQRYTQTHGFLYAGVGIISCFTIGYAVSLILPAQGKDLRGTTIYTQEHRN